MPRNVDNVTIKEPPIRELNKNRSCLRRSCMTGCLFLFLLIIGFLFIVKFAATPRVRQLKKIPDIVPAEVPIYDKENIESIRYIAAKERTKTIEIAALIPKAILVPLYVGTHEYLPEEVQNIFGNSKEGEGWGRYMQLLREPIFPTKDLIEIEWTELPAQPDFVKEFYEKELQQAGFSVVEIVNETEIEEIRFGNAGDYITGIFYTEDNTPDVRGTDRAILKLELSVTN